MIIYDSEQGEAQWFADRAGVITSSMFVEIRKRVGGLNEQQEKFINFINCGLSENLAAEQAGYASPPKSQKIIAALNGEKLGDFTDAAKSYAFKLAVERISKSVLDAEGFKLWQAERGNRLEEDCRKRHEADIGELSDLAGFITTDCGRFGCSADALVGADGGGEYKAFLKSDKVKKIIIDRNWEDVMDQVQGCMWITGRQWWDVCLYFPALACINKDFTRDRIESDQDYQKLLSDDLEEFDALVEQYKAQIIGTNEEAVFEPEEELQQEYEFEF